MGKLTAADVGKVISKKLVAKTGSNAGAAKLKTIEEPNRDLLADKYDTRTTVSLKTPTIKSRRGNKKIRWPKAKVQKFVVYRIIPPSDKAGSFENVDPAAFCENNWNPKDDFEWGYGSMLLSITPESSSAGGDQIRLMRNMIGGERRFASRVLQKIHLPWNLPTNLPFDEGGVPLKMAVAKELIPWKDAGGRQVEKGEIILVLTRDGAAEDCMVPFIDWEGFRGMVSGSLLLFDHGSWSLTVNAKVKSSLCLYHNAFGYV